MYVQPQHEPIFSIDLKSPIKSIWIGWWLVTWSNPVGGYWWEIVDFDISWMAGGD